jgi:hypothetical protein
MAYYDRQPVIYPLYRLIEELLTGDVRVPRFQRPGTEITWRPEQRGDLIDSVLRNFPIGTIMLWSTQTEVATLDVVGGAKIPPHDGNRPRRLVLDGHQRLSTLVRLLGPGLSGVYVEDAAAWGEAWHFDVADNPELTLNRERLHSVVGAKQRQSERLSKAIPLAIVLDRIKVNQWVRQQELADDEVARVDQLRDALREYQIPVVTLVTSDLDEATESFKRVNSSGAPMETVHMVGALAYGPRFDLLEALRAAKDAHLEPTGWGETDDTDILRVIAGLLRERESGAGLHPVKLDVLKLAQAVRREPRLVNDAVSAMASAAEVLAAIGVLGPQVLPYAWQFNLLAIALGSARLDVQTDAQRSAAERWFWRTTYGEVFQGANSAIVDRALRTLREMLAGREDGSMNRDIAVLVPAPGKCDFRTARTRAALLAMARAQDETTGTRSASEALRQGNAAVRQLWPSLPRSTLGNLHIAVDFQTIKDIRDALRPGSTAPDGSQHLSAIAGLDTGSLALAPEETARRREARLWAAERAFITRWDLKPDDLASDSSGLDPDRHGEPPAGSG